jgi:hypothetical protein
MALYRILSGMFVGFTSDEMKKPPKDRKETIWRGGVPGQDIIDSDDDLCGFNPSTRGMDPKFERVAAYDTPAGWQTRPPTQSDPTYQQPAAATKDTKPSAGLVTPQMVQQQQGLAATIDSMSLKELHTLANEEEIDLKGSKDLTEIRKILKSAGSRPRTAAHAAK